MSYSFYVNTFDARTHSAYMHNAVRTPEDYTPDEMAALIAGDDVPVEWDEDGLAVVWDCIDFDDEDQESLDNLGRWLMVGRFEDKED